MALMHVQNNEICIFEGEDDELSPRQNDAAYEGMTARERCLLDVRIGKDGRKEVDWYNNYYYVPFFCAFSHQLILDSQAKSGLSFQYA